MTESLTIMQEIMRSRSTHNLHYGVRPRHVYFVKVQQGKNAYYGSKRTSGKNVPECKMHREKSSVTYGKYRENSVALAFLASELVVIENNALSGLDGFGTGFQNNVQAQGSLVNNTNLIDENGKLLNPATPEEIKYASDKLVTGELPEGANITKAIVEGYQDGVMIAGAWYLGPAASVGKVISGGVIAEIANGSYQCEPAG